MLADLVGAARVLYIRFAAVDDHRELRKLYLAVFAEAVLLRFAVFGDDDSRALFAAD